MDSEDRFSRIADLSEQIAKLNALLEIHRQTTADALMIHQYTYRRDEFLKQLQYEFHAINMTISLVSAA